MLLAYIPSPSRSVWHLGPLPIRAYALCIVLGIIVALWLGARRFRARGGKSEDVWDVAGWAIVLGIIGGRLYHVVTDPELYFEGKPGTSPLGAFKIWDGGLGIWGAIALGTAGAWIGCRRKKISLRVFADAVVPGVALAQGIGRWGNWFNNELYGDPTKLPWGLQIHCIDVSVGHAVAGGQASGGEMCPPGSGTLVQHFVPTFLYESIWDILIAFLIIYLDRRLRLGRGNVMALYVMAYTAGRGYIETLRSDHANHIFGVRINVFTAIIVGLLALLYFVLHGGFRAQRESTPYTGTRAEPPDADAAPTSSPPSSPSASEASPEATVGADSDE